IWDFFGAWSLGFGVFTEHLARTTWGSHTMGAQIKPEIHKSLQGGLVIPACPLALNAARKLDERRQRALVRYYAAAGAGGLAVGVHTTQFAIRDPKIGLFAPVLELVADELKRSNIAVRIGGVCGPTTQAVREAELLKK